METKNTTGPQGITTKRIQYVNDFKTGKTKVVAKGSIGGDSSVTTSGDNKFVNKLGCNDTWHASPTQGLVNNGMLKEMPEEVGSIPDDSTAKELNMETFIAKTCELEKDSPVEQGIQTDTKSIMGKITTSHCSTQTDKKTARDKLFISDSFKTNGFKDCSSQTDCKDGSTQTDFCFSSIQEMYSVLCEKCGHKINMQEIVLNLMNYPLMLESGHLCMGLEEQLIIDRNLNTLEIEDDVNMPPEPVISEYSRHNYDKEFKNAFLSQSGAALSFDQLEPITPGHQNFKTDRQNTKPDDSIESVSNSGFSVQLTFTSTNTEWTEGHFQENKDPRPKESEDLSDNYPYTLQDQFATEDLDDAFDGFHHQYQSLQYPHKEYDDFHEDNSSSQYSSQSSENIYSASSEVMSKTKNLVSEINNQTKGVEHIERMDPRSKKIMPPRNPADYSTESPTIKGSFNSTTYRSVYNPIYNTNVMYPKLNTATTVVKTQNKHSYKHRPNMMDKLSYFAEENLLDVHNVSADGNCMFSAVVDQLWINGNFRFTADSLRKDAVEFLKKAPTHRDGSHLESFLTTESWEEYLQRMARNGEWGDHMVLQGVAEVTLSRIIVINSNIIKTELTPWHTPTDTMKLDNVILGHLGEYHYVSLRPSNWRGTWAIRAKIKRINELKNSTPFKQMMTNDNSIKHVTETETNDEHTSTAENEVSENQQQEEENGDETMQRKDNNNSKSAEKTEELDLSYITIENTELIERAQTSRATTDLFDKKEDLDGILSEHDYIDRLSDVSIVHLSFCLQRLLEPEDIGVKNLTHNIRCSISAKGIRASNFETVVYGSVGEELCVYPEHYYHTVLRPHVLCYKSEISSIVYNLESATDSHSLVVDMTSCNPGFLRLYIPEQHYFENCCLVTLDDKVFLKSIYNVDFSLPNETGCVRPKTKEGLQCQEWPQLLTSDWRTRERLSGWPESKTLAELSSRPCHIRKHSHSSSSHPEIEWQFIFPEIEVDLLLHFMDKNMKYALRYLKMLIDCHTASSPKLLKTNHLKTIMLYCCEQLPTSVWSANVGGAILFVISKLMMHLHNRNLPHYIMSAVNLLDDYSENELDSLLRDLEHIRLFPFMSIHVFAENNELTNQWIIQQIVSDMHRFRNDKDILMSIEKTFCPILIETAKRLVMKGIYHFHKGYKTIEMAFEKTRTKEEKMEVESRLTFEQFIEPFLYSIDDPIVRYYFTSYVDRTLGTNTLKKMTESDHVRKLSDITEKEDGGMFNDFPIPDGNRMDDAEYLESFSDYLMIENQNVSAAHFLRCGISLAKQGRCSETIDIGEIEEEDIRRQIDEKNNKTIQHFNNMLHQMYTKLFKCYNDMRQKMLFQEFIHEYEELVIILNHPCYYRTLANTWRELGNEEKSQFFYDKLNENKHELQSTRV